MRSRLDEFLQVILLYKHLIHKTKELYLLSLYFSAPEHQRILAGTHFPSRWV